MQTTLKRSTLECDVPNPRWQAIPMRLFLFALGIIRGFSRRENWQRYFQNLSREILFTDLKENAFRIIRFMKFLL